MLIVCPACASEYRIEADRVGMEGRSVRCAACRETWFVSPADVLAGRSAELDAQWEAVAETGSGVPAPEPPGAVVENVPSRPARRRPGAAPPPSGKPSRRRGMAGLSPARAAALALLAALPLALLARTTVVRAMPQTAGLYARIGLPVNLRGLELRDVVAFRTPAVDGMPARLSVEGDVLGVAAHAVPVPVIEVAVRDADGRPLRVFTIPAPRPTLEAAERARFGARFDDPPAEGRAIEVRFAAAAPAHP